MISSKVENALNEQIKKEFYSSYLYLSMAAHFESINLKGLANWMKIQANEETKHAMKIYNYTLERGGKVVFQRMDAPPSKWESPERVFSDAYKHEQKVTESIDRMVDLARSEKDNATGVFLQWFVNEQVEEEASTHEITQKLKMIGGNPPALIMLDAELAKRSPS